MDRVFLEGLVFYGRHGARPEEQALGQRFRVDLEVEVDLTSPARTDRLEDTVSYSALYRLVREVVEGPPRSLLEAVAEEVARRVLAAFPAVRAVRVRLTKPMPPIAGAVTGSAGVEVVRRRPEA